MEQRIQIILGVVIIVLRSVAFSLDEYPDRRKLSFTPKFLLRKSSELLMPAVTANDIASLLTPA